MRTLIPLLSLLFYTSSLFGQTFSKEQALQLAGTLHQEQILSEKGKNRLISKIEQGLLSRPVHAGPLSPKGKKSKVLSPAQFLHFLQQAFANDYCYRSGAMEQPRLLGIYMKKNQIKNFDEKSYAAFQKWAEEQMKSFAGQQIEQAISDEESFPEDSPAYNLSCGSVSDVNIQWVHSVRSAMGKTASRTLADLLRLNLIDQSIHDETALKIENKEMILESQLIGYAADKVMYKEDLEQNKALEKDFLENLKAKGLLTAAKHQQLLDSYEGQELKDRFAFLKYCDQAQVFERDQYPEETETAYRRIFEDIRAIAPDFDFTNFEVTITEKEKKGMKQVVEQQASISFEMGGRSYQQLFVHNLIEQKEDGSTKNVMGAPKINASFHQGINEWLKNTGSEKRLYFTRPQAKDLAKGTEQFALLLLTEEQFKAWLTHKGDAFLSAQSHDNTFSPANIQTIIAQYEELGLFTGLSPQQITAAKKQVEQKNIDAYQDILNCFPDAIAYFDMEAKKANMPYKDLCQVLQKASKGAFAPNNIVDEFKVQKDSLPSLFTFDLKDKTYRHELVKNEDWLDMSIFTTINKALKAAGIDGSFHRCISGWQNTGYIFLTAEQKKQLKAKQPMFFSKAMMKLGVD
ncbi:MAG: hypothetical protein AAGG75_09790 [Bacteroidota bacterium]